ncbi:hypothetical protein [uncultured Roseovarius sp.]|uniref:hypothetical protein n=1 Tax=uncultured Roseovarius sp. TaxID=293344 RepID=UPI002629225F|nr:hypothetical protein [uncultured Roseovarius sp.]
MKTIGAVPQAERAGRTFQANVIFASSEDNLRKLTTRLAALERARMARSSGEREILAFSSTPEKRSAV